MKARINALLATAVVALSIAAGASAAPQQGSVKGWDYTRLPSASTGWTSYHPGTVKPWASWSTARGRSVKPSAIWSSKLRPSAFGGWERF